MFPHVEGPDNIGFALGETLAHLACLEGRGRARRYETGSIVRFRAA